MQRGPAGELATYDALRPDVFPPSGPFCPKKTRSVVNQKRREISKSRNICLPRVNRTENRLVDGGPLLAEGSASPAFGFPLWIHPCAGRLPCMRSALLCHSRPPGTNLAQSPSVER
jgi:hypothetical protein